MSLGEIIREKRRALGLTQLDLAERIDVSILKLATWEADEELPTDEQFISLSKALECQIKDLTDKPIYVQEEVKVIEEAKVEEKPLVEVEAKSEEKPSIIEEIPVIKEEAIEFKKEASNVVEAPRFEKEKIEDTNELKIENEKKDIYVLCPCCKKTVKSNQFFTYNTKYYQEKLKISVCENCHVKLDAQIKENIAEIQEAKLISTRKFALGLQFGIFFFLSMWSLIYFISALYVAGIVFLLVAIFSSCFAANLVFNNVSYYIEWRNLLFENRKDVNAAYIIFGFFIVFFIAPFVYPTTLKRNFKSKEFKLSPYDIEKIQGSILVKYKPKEK